MIYSQFQQSPMQNRFSGTRGWLAFAIGLVIMTLTLVALPFMLLFGAISFFALSLFGRVFLKRQLARFAQHRAGFTDSTQKTSDEPLFREPARSTPHQGRTFEHNPNE